MKKEEVRFETVFTEDARFIIAAFGSMARVSKTSVDLARKEGMKVGLFQTHHPLPLSGKSPLRSFTTGETIFNGRIEYRTDGGGCETFGGPGCGGLFLRKTTRRLTSLRKRYWRKSRNTIDQWKTRGVIATELQFQCNSKSFRV